jgi:hypothetical protein
MWRKKKTRDTLNTRFFTLAGNVFYTLVLLGGFALAQRYIPVLRVEPATVPALG